MNIKDLVQDAPNLSRDQFNRRLNTIMLKKSRFANLDQKNRKTVIDTIKKRWDYIRKGRGVSSDAIRRDCYGIYQKRNKMGLSKEDYKDMKDILGEFKR